MNEVGYGAHPPRRQLAAYVQGELDGFDAESLEGHVARCDACSGSLAREARVEVALHQVAARASMSARRSAAGGARGARFAAGGAIAAAALLVVWLARGASPSSDAMSDAGPLSGSDAAAVDGG